MTCNTDDFAIVPTHPFVANATNELLARATARRATGSSTGVADEWKWLLQANVHTVVRKVYDLSSSTPSTAINTQSLTVADVIYDTAQSWSKDSVGWNFADAIPGTVMTSPGSTYRVDYTVTLASGIGAGVGVIRFEGIAR